MRAPPLRRGGEQPRSTTRCGFLVALELSFNGRLVYDRPYLRDLPLPKFIENILGEGNSLPIDLKAKERSLRGTIEAQPACDIRRIGHQQLDVKMKVRNLRDVFLQHLAITR